MIDNTIYEKFRQKYEMDAKNKVIEHAIANVGIKESSVRQDVIRKHTFVFSDETKRGEITNQKRSGRCWMFSALNVARVKTMEKLNLETFEYSQCYLQFYDKIEKANSYLDYVIERQRAGAKLQFLSVTGMSYDENIALLKKIQESEYEGVTEFNLSCPNVPGKPQIAYDFELTDKLLAEVFTFFTKPIGVKLPPYFDIAHFDEMAKILNKYPLTYVNSVNSVGNGLYIDLDKEQVVIKPKGGFGGLGGEYIKPTALANVRAFRERLNPSIKIIGTGGVINGKDVFEHILCGADLVQVGTTLHKEGVSVFARLTKELQEVMKEKGYSSLDDFRGKLKVIE